MNVFFTGDTHYGHKRIIEFSERPFADLVEMRETMIARWNAVVRPGDQVYHLGDFAFLDEDDASSIAWRLMGQKFLVFGNHDKALRKSKAFLGHFAWAKDLADIKVGDQRIVLCHYAMRVFNQSHRGAWQLHGHSHGSLKDDPSTLQTDVGVDCWDYRPVSFDEIRQVMSRKQWRPVDHHGEDE